VQADATKLTRKSLVAAISKLLTNPRYAAAAAAAGRELRARSGPKDTAELLLQFAAEEPAAASQQPVKLAAAAPAVVQIGAFTSEVGARQGGDVATAKDTVAAATAAAAAGGGDVATEKDTAAATAAAAAAAAGGGGDVATEKDTAAAAVKGEAKPVKGMCHPHIDIDARASTVV
jgi:hypothetical protein